MTLGSLINIIYTTMVSIDHVNYVYNKCEHGGVNLCIL